jgi:hypothetical protein
LAERPRLELGSRITPTDGLAIHSNTIMGPLQTLVGSQGIEPRMPKGGGFTVHCSHQCCSLPILKHTKPNMLEYGVSVAD